MFLFKTASATRCEGKRPRISHRLQYKKIPQSELYLSMKSIRDRQCVLRTKIFFTPFPYANGPQNISEFQSGASWLHQIKQVHEQISNAYKIYEQKPQVGSLRSLVLLKYQNINTPVNPINFFFIQDAHPYIQVNTYFSTMYPVLQGRSCVYPKKNWLG